MNDPNIKYIIVLAVFVAFAVIYGILQRKQK